MPYKRILTLLALSITSSQAAVVFSELNFSTNEITLHNNGTGSVGLDGWRFCSHDTNQARVYSATTALNGQSVAAGSSLTIDLSTLNFAGPLDTTNTLSVGLYVDSSFGSAASLETFLQYTPTGNLSFGNAETRTGTAVTAGVWDAAGSFVQVAATDTSIVLNNVNSSTGASSFSTINASSVPEPSSAALLGFVFAGSLLRRKRK